MKVYCKDCKYFKEVLHPIEGFVISEKCEHLDNFTIKSSHRNSYPEFIAKPEQRNGGNNCYIYERKWWKIFN